MGKGDHVDHSICIDLSSNSSKTEPSIIMPSHAGETVPESFVRSRHQSSGGVSGGSGSAGNCLPILGRLEKLSESNGGMKCHPSIQSLNAVERRNSVHARPANGVVCQKHHDLETDSYCKDRNGPRGAGSNRRNYLMLTILLMANLINYMDRYTIAGVLEEVKNFYSLNNAEAGLLQTSFILSYMLLSPVFGYLGDRYNRKYIMAAGVFFWSIVTLGGSFVDRDKYAAFLFMRALVGVGEASYSTIAPSIIADTFTKATRTKALSIFYFAIPVGSGLGYIVGSKVAVAAGGWQWSLRVTPGLGLICALLVLVVVVEPPRGASEGAAHIRGTSYRSDIVYLLKHKSFILSSLGFTCVAFVAGALALWAPLYMHRSMKVQQVKMDVDTVSMIFGVITCAAGFSGVAIGSFAASKLRPFTKKADPLVCAFGLITGAPLLYLAICFSTYGTVIPWVLIFFGETLLSLNWALVTDILMYIVIPTRRSTAEAFQILISHAFGDAGSPYLVGVVSDAIEDSYHGRKDDLMVQYLSLQYSLYMACFVCVIGGGFFLATALFIQRDREQTDKVIKGESSSDSSSPSTSSAAVGSDSGTPSDETASSSLSSSSYVDPVPLLQSASSSRELDVMRSVQSNSEADRLPSTSSAEL